MTAQPATTLFNINTWEQALLPFEVIDLKTINQSPLQNRVDSKFAFSVHQLKDILSQLQHDYKVLAINGKRIAQYETIYFDTDAFQFYTDHHNEKPNRFKVRVRRYTDTDTVFFEIKRKIKCARIDKIRVNKNEFNGVLTDNEIALLHQYDIKPESLSIKNAINYSRITFAGIHTPERVTLDLNMHVSNQQLSQQFSDLVIAEVKQEKLSRNSKFIQLMKAGHIQEVSMSKYSITVALLEQDIKTNNFRNKIKALYKILEQP